jgi:acetylglutamate kinase
VSLLVVKCGGAVVPSAAASIEAFAAGGHEVCVVHGAGPQISAAMERLGLPVEFVRGRRVTSPAALEIVRESLAAVNQELCRALGPRALGLMGDEIGLEAIPLPEIGLVGDPVPSRPAAVVHALGQGLVPVVAPLAKGPLNVNADEAAAALALGLRAPRLLFVSDVPGVLLGGSPLPSIGADEADHLLGEGTFADGIVPKLIAAVRAVRGGVDVHIGETAVLP